MSRTLIAALVLAGLALPSIAQETGGDAAGASDPAQAQEDAPEGGDTAQDQPYITASMIQDARIVSLEGDYDASVWDGEAPFEAMIADLTEIGEVDEIVLDDQGQVQGVTTDVGGFLGIGDKAVMIPLKDIRLARSPDNPSQLTIVTRLDQQALEDSPEFEVDD